MLLSTIDINGSLNINSGNFNAAGLQITIAGDWTDNGTFTHNNNRVIFDGTGTITTNETFWELEQAGGTTTLQALTADITIEKGLLLSSGILAGGNNTITLSGDLFDSDGTGDGSAGLFTGTFTDDSSTVIITNPGITNIYGSNTFWNFECTTNGATILFQIAELQIIANNIILTGTDGTNQEVKLGNENGFLQDPPAPDFLPPAAVPLSPIVDALNQWELRIDTSATITDVRIQWCFAVNPITPHPTSEDFNGNNGNWLFTIPIEYSWTEDIDGDGRIDRIRVHVNVGVDLSDTFAGVTAWVDGYSVSGFTSGELPGISEYDFFIDLVEGDELDTDVTPQWRLTDNSTLVTGLFGTVGGAFVEYGGSAPLQTPMDRAAPAVGYTLAVAGKDEVFVHFSEYVCIEPGGAALTAGDFIYNGVAAVNTLTPITTDGGNGISELILTFTAPGVVDANELYNDSDAYNLLTITPTLDDMVDLAAVNGINDLFLPNTANYRASDLALGLTGAGMIQPVYALNDAALTIRDAARGGIGEIERVEYGDFDGTGWLQDQDFSMQVSIDTAMAVANTEDIDILWDTSVGSPYLLNGMWLPPYVPADARRDFLCDLINVVNPSSVLETDPVGPFTDSLRDYQIDAENAKITSGKEFQFFMRDTKGFLYGRVGNSSAANWYRTVRPWSFLIREVIEQPSRVSILDNVIDPTKGEKAELHYILEKSGTITIQVFNLAGDLIDILHRGRQNAGEYTTSWDGRNRNNAIVVRGIYFIRFTGPGIDEYRKVMVVK